MIGSITQGEFLQNLGINIRAEMLKQGARAEHDIEFGLHRLIGDNEMGKLFRVLEIFL